VESFCRYTRGVREKEYVVLVTSIGGSGGKNDDRGQHNGGQFWRKLG